jgi:uncharacterized membrane protein YfcA
VHPVDSITVYVVMVIFIATLIRSTLGFGEALFSVPLLALRIPVSVAAPLAVMVSVLVAAVIVAQDWQRIDLRSAGGLIAASLVGIPAGILLLATVNDHAVRLTLGVIIVLFSTYSLTSGTRSSLPGSPFAWLVTCGFFAGVLGGAYGMNGPPLAIYGSFRKWPPQQFRATLQGYFLPASVVGLAGYAAIGLWRPEIGRYFLCSLPGVAVATLLGRSFNRRIEVDRFRRVVYGGLLLVGLVLLLQAFTR